MFIFKILIQEKYKIHSPYNLNNKIQIKYKEKRELKWGKGTRGKLHVSTTNSNDGFAAAEFEALSRSFHGQKKTVVFTMVVDVTNQCDHKQERVRGLDSRARDLVKASSKSTEEASPEQCKKDGRCHRYFFLIWRSYYIFSCSYSTFTTHSLIMICSG